MRAKPARRELSTRCLSASDTLGSQPRLRADHDEPTHDTDRFMGPEEIPAKLFAARIQPYHVAGCLDRLAGRRADADGRRFLRRSVKLANRYLRPGQRAAYTIQTNGTQVDGERAGTHVSGRARHLSRAPTPGNRRRSALHSRWRFPLLRRRCARYPRRPFSLPEHSVKTAGEIRP